MTTKPCIFLAPLVVCLSLACNDKVEPPPQFNTVLTTGDEGSGGRLTPVRLTKRDKSSLIAPAASGETPPAVGGPAAATPQSTEVTVDTSTPEAAAQSFVAILKSGQFALLPDIIVSEQQETLQQMIRLTQPVQEALAELERAIAEKFPGHAFRMGGLSVGMPADVQITNIEVGDTEATATFEAAGRPAEPIKFRQIDGKWRVEAPLFNQAPSEDDVQAMSEVSTKLANAFRDVAAKINDGSITDAQAIPAELAEATAMPEALFSVGPQGEGGNTEAAPGAAEEDAEAPAEPGVNE
ncbi:MAG TPA: hypothetical protein PKG54_16825 [Phycisphaerae bacterium]|jgi:hypothetical protein|nr:hypothetical protein [Phycisphaerae bacterium]HOB76179.1 hypothetical protein [Phycisphaerae bacterium]HOJ54582.1 hypothetical protein [Phycisphaerae bacterium]HOL27025.1 hypothetical protein [Phycisphaerae bacterium]HPP22805.1 hypothetical protein [Phycisphaerae bacterium]